MSSSFCSNGTGYTRCHNRQHRNEDAQAKHQPWTYSESCPLPQIFGLRKLQRLDISPTCACGVWVLRTGWIREGIMAVDIFETLAFSLIRDRDTTSTAVNFEAHFSARSRPCLMVTGIQSTLYKAKVPQDLRTLCSFFFSAAAFAKAGGRRVF